MTRRVPRPPGPGQKPRRFSPRVCRACGRAFLPRSALQRYGSAFCKSRGPVWRDMTGYAGPWAVPGRPLDHD